MGEYFSVIGLTINIINAIDSILWFLKVVMATVHRHILIKFTRNVTFLQLWEVLLLCTIYTLVEQQSKARKYRSFPLNIIPFYFAESLLPVDLS